MDKKDDAKTEKSTAAPYLQQTQKIKQMCKSDNKNFYKLLHDNG
jgi:hypothetical protein